MPKQNGEHGTARAPKQRARECAGCTHSGVSCTRKGYGKRCPGAFGAILVAEKIQLSEARPVQNYTGNLGRNAGRVEDWRGIP